MAVAYKDIVATLATTGVVVMSYAKLKGYEWPLLSSWRMATLALLILGLDTCIIVGSNITEIRGTWLTVGAVMGCFAMGVALLGLLFNSKVLFLLLSINIVCLWALSTAHHILSNGG